MNRNTSNPSPAFLPERYLNYNTVLKNEFEERVQKISINAGFTCPNRDGSKGTGGCTYCNNQTFSPEYCRPDKTITQQLEEGVAFFHHKYATQQYLAYFQAYTNTYAETSRLIEMYEEALLFPQVVGLVIGTRPDCVSDELLDYLSSLTGKYYLMVEYGIESTSDETLKRINRGHNYACAEEAIRRTAAQGIHTGAHLILGLPGEDHDTMMQHAHRLSELPLTMIKLHQLQLVKGTVMAQEYLQHPENFQLLTAAEYCDLAIDFMEQLSPNIAIERFVSQSPKGMLIAPDWGLKNFEFQHQILKRLKERNTWQGKLIIDN